MPEKKIHDRLTAGIGMLNTGATSDGVDDVCGLGSDEDLEVDLSAAYEDAISLLR